MTLAEILSKLQAEGMTQCTGTLAVDENLNSVEISQKNMSKIKGCCVMGSIEIAKQRDWITPKQQVQLEIDLVNACFYRFGSPPTSCNDILSITFDQFKQLGI